MAKTLFFASALALIATPAISNAAGATDLKSLVSEIIGLVNDIIPLLFGLASIAFMWGVIKYLFSAEPKKIAEAKSYIIFSIVAIAVMLSVWSLALLIKNSIFPTASCPITVPGCTQGTQTDYNPNIVPPEFQGPPVT